MGKKNSYKYPLRKKIEFTSIAYRHFLERERKKPSFYEKAANFSTRFIRIKPDKDTQNKLQAAIDFTGMRTTPTAITSLTLFIIILFSIFGVGTIILRPDLLTGGAVIAIVGVALGFYTLRYPEGLVKTYRVRASSQVVLAILYMVVSMRISPNLERALRYAAANISGELAWDLRRLLWDVEMRTYYSASDALTEYIGKWKQENEEFAESLRLINDSQVQSPDNAEKTLNEALNVILEGTKTRMKHYTEDLRTPVMVIHMMGIILPVLGAIMAPMAAAFLGDAVRAEHFIIGYDIVLPLIILWFIRSTLSKRPITFSQIDIGKHPDLPPKGCFMLKRKKKKFAFPALPISLIIIIALFLPAIYYFVQNPTSFFPTKEIVGKGIPPESLYFSLLFVLGTALAIAVYYILSNFQAMKVQGDIQATEDEFEIALFQLGNRMSSGVPAEVAVEKALDDVKDRPISNLFRRTVENIRGQNMTFERALFDKEYGALRYYPSKLINNVMYTMVDTSKRGYRYASEAMLTVSRYLKNIKETQEYIREILSETASSMKFQAYILTPMITGLIVSLSEVITKVLGVLGAKLQGSGVFGNAGFLQGSTSLFPNIEQAIPPSIFQIIIGVYLIEVIIILAIFLTKISYGNSKVIQQYTAGKMLLVGIAMYLIVALLSRFMLVGLIDRALSTLVGI